MRLALVALLLVACSGSKGEIGPEVTSPTKPDAGETPSSTVATSSTSGSRLKARVMVGADGSRSFVGWHDTELKTDCAFVKSVDGKTRCLPSGTNVLPGYFTDSGCTKPAAYTTKGCAPSSKYVQAIQGGACGAGYAVYQLGTPHTASVYVGSPGACNSTTVGLSSYDVYTLGPEVSLASFVAGNEELN